MYLVAPPDMVMHVPCTLCSSGSPLASKRRDESGVTFFLFWRRPILRSLKRSKSHDAQQDSGAKKESCVWIRFHARLLNGALDTCSTETTLIRASNGCAPTSGDDAGRMHGASETGSLTYAGRALDMCESTLRLC